MAITIKTTKLSKFPCGFCSSGAHDHCPGGVLNGDGVTVIVCDCTEHEAVRRCLDCGARGDVNPETWTCADADSCQAVRDRHRRETQERLFPGMDDAPAVAALGKPANRSQTPRKAAGTCLCCGEPTKGGNYLPGHDSRHLTMLAKGITEGLRTLEDAQSHLPTDALRAKLAKRVSA